MRAFVCLTTQSDNDTLGAVAVCAPDRASALASGIATLSNGSSHVVGVLTQEEVSGMGMLLAASREVLSAASSIEA